MVFFHKFCEVSKNTFFTEYLRMAASVAKMSRFLTANNKMLEKNFRGWNLSRKQNIKAWAKEKNIMVYLLARMFYLT